MEAVVPWPRLLAVIEPHYPKAEQGRPPHPLPRMLRIYFMQQWFNLSDPAMQDALYDSEAMRRFAGIELTANLVPDEMTILRFRHLLEQHRLTAALFAEVRQLLEEKKLLLKSGTIVDATIIAAPPSTPEAGLFLCAWTAQNFRRSHLDRGGTPCRINTTSRRRIRILRTSAAACSAAATRRAQVSCARTFGKPHSTGAPPTRCCTWTRCIRKVSIHT
jgi:IS5 family transposase